MYRATDSSTNTEASPEETTLNKSMNETNDIWDKNGPSSIPTQTFSSLPQLPLLTTSHCSMDEVLQLLRQLYIISTQTPKVNTETLNTRMEQDMVEHQIEDDRALGMHSIIDLFTSQKITNKLVQQIQDPLVLSANSMPDWCQELTFSCPMLFPFDTRLLHFQCTAFGASRR